MSSQVIHKGLIDKLSGLKTVSSKKEALEGLKVREKLDKVLLILLDTSGSMCDYMEGRSKITVAWNIIRMQLLPNMTNWGYGILCFGGVIHWIKSLNDKSNNLVLSQYPEATGSTSMGTALTAAWIEVIANAKEARIILLSDGMPTDMSKEEILRLATDHTTIPIDTVGIGVGTLYSYDPDFLRKLSKITGGMFSEANSIQLLENTIKRLSPKERPLLGRVSNK